MERIVHTPQLVSYSHCMDDVRYAVLCLVTCMLPAALLAEKQPSAGRSNVDPVAQVTRLYEPRREERGAVECHS